MNSRKYTYSEMLKNLYKFYNENYIITVYDNEIIYYDKLSYILAYEAIDIEKNINNNIQEHFITHLNQFVNHSFNLQEQKDEIKKIKDKELRKEKYKYLSIEYKKVKDDLVSLSLDLTADEKYHNWVKEHKYILYLIKLILNNLYFYIRLLFHYYNILKC